MTSKAPIQSITTDLIPAEHLAQITAIAKMCHAVNRAYCAALREEQPSWEDAPQWQKDSVIAGVAFRILNPDTGPEASHVNWMQQKLAEGWTYGKVKDPAKKKHHCLVPFHHLPTEQQAKDHIFRAIVHQAVFALEEALEEEAKEDDTHDLH